MESVSGETTGEAAGPNSPIRTNRHGATRRLLFVRRAENQKPPTLLRLGLYFKTEQGTERPRICEFVADLFGVYPPWPYPLKCWRD